MVEITTHTLVKNEDRWVWFSLKAWEPYASKMLVFDDDSTDNTQEIIESLHSKKTIYKRIQIESPAQMTDARQVMKLETKNPWFVILDGDEIWNSSIILNFMKHLESVGPKIAMVALRTRNCIGDIYHYLDESYGQYEILGMRGHFNVRAYRNDPKFHWYGKYPLEYYGDKDKTDLLKNPSTVSFFDSYYWHMTHLPRSSKKTLVKGWRKIKYGLGIAVSDTKEFPEVFSLPRPALVANPWKRRSLTQVFIAMSLAPLRYLKRKVKFL